MISEKSLELNISENIIRQVRHTHRNAFLYGFTLRQEHGTALDVSINLNSGLSISGLQFKKPVSSSAGIYRFEINNNKSRDQHIKLWLLSNAMHQIFKKSLIHYAFPAFFDTHELGRASPNFLPRTYFIDPYFMPFQILDSNIHVVEIDTNNNNAIVFSEPIKMKILESNDFLDNINKKEFTLEIIKFKELKNVRLADINFKDVTNIQEYQKIKELIENKWSVKLKGIVLN